MMEPADLLDIEKALDAFETLHDAQLSESARHCLCGEAASWRRAIAVTHTLRKRMGLRTRLTDEALMVEMYGEKANA